MSLRRVTLLSGECNALSLRRSRLWRMTKCNVGFAFLRYTFWTRDYDIKFGVRRKATKGGGGGGDSPRSQVVPLKKYAAQAVPVDNTFPCDTPATCKHQSKT